MTFSPLGVDLSLPRNNVCGKMLPAWERAVSNPRNGGMAEWTKAPVLKTGMEQSIVGSNPTSSAPSVVKRLFTTKFEY